MKTLLAIASVALLAGCATTENVQVAQKECKLAPVTTASVVNSDRKPKVSPIRQREAEMDLANSQYRMAQLNRNGLFNNNIEEAMRDCDTAR